MRVDQILTLLWVGNAALLGGTGWVGWTFWQQRQAQREVPKFAWPETEVPPISRRWPGAVGGFRHIWDTPLNGLVPPPPPPPDTGPAKPVDVGASFRSRIKIEKAIDASDPELTILVISDNGQQRQVSQGQAIDEWQLQKVRIDRETGAAIARFYNPRYEKDQGTIEIRQEFPELKDILAESAPPFTREVGGALADGLGTLGPNDPQAWLDPETGEWQVPSAEVRYWEDAGQKEILQQTKFVERPNGLEIASQPPRGPLLNTRGLNQGDVVVSINDVAVKSMDDVYRYFRGEGRGLRRYVFVIERDGRQRTQTYNVRRR